MARRTVLDEMRSIGTLVRAVLRDAGLRLGRPALAWSDEGVHERARDDEAVIAIVAPLPVASLPVALRTMRAQFTRLTRQVLAIIRGARRPVSA